MKKLIYILFFMLLISALSSCSKKDSIQSIVEEIPGAKTFTLSEKKVELPLINGGSDSFQNYSGKVIMLVVWLSSCGYCQAEAPSLAELDKYLRNDNRVQLLGVSVDSNVEEAKSFVDTYGLKFSNMLDTSGQKLQALGFTILGTPTTFIITPKGDVVGRVSGHYEFDPKEQYKTLLKLYKFYEKK